MTTMNIVRGNIAQTKVFATSLGPTAPASVAANITAPQTFTIRGVKPGDYINCQCATAQTAGISIANVRVSAVDTIIVDFNNSTAGALVPVAGPYGFVWGTPESLPLGTDAT
jgi:hypothetical protein